jgi:hypothetical protein
MSENYRLAGLQREADEISEHLRKNVGLMGCDLEVIGALLFTKYRGEDDRIEELNISTSKLLKEADEFLEKLRNKHE